MKVSYKPLALAVSVAGLSGAALTVSAQPFPGLYPTLGDAAFVPYYTVEEDWVTGVHSSPVGWAALTVSGTDKGLGSAWCDVAAGPVNTDECTMMPVSGAVPMVGFAAWERTFADDRDRNYGRIIEHSFTADFAPPG